MIIAIIIHISAIPFSKPFLVRQDALVVEEQEVIMGIVSLRLSNSPQSYSSRSSST